MVSDEPDIDGNIPVPLDDAAGDLTLLTGGWDPDGALLRARGRRVTWGYLSEDDFALVSRATESELTRHHEAYAEQQRRSMSVRLMIVPTTAWERLLRTVRRRCGDSADGSVLVSLVFCHPRSVVFRDLKAEYTYLDQRSGANWDLNFVGYACSAGRALPPSVAGVPLWRFHAVEFDALRQELQDAHADALARSEAPFDMAGWRYSGRPELVSFMAYRDHPELIDWLSLRAVRLVDADGDYLDRSLSEVVEVLSDWRELDNDDLRDLAPGEPPRAVSAAQIGRALRAVAAAIAGGVAGNAAYELIKAAIT
jgi:hypothetical protein